MTDALSFSKFFYFPDTQSACRVYLIFELLLNIAGIMVAYGMETVEGIKKVSTISLRALLRFRIISNGLEEIMFRRLKKKTSILSKAPPLNPS